MIETSQDTKELMFCGKNKWLRQRVSPNPPSNLQAESRLSLLALSAGHSCDWSVYKPSD